MNSLSIPTFFPQDFVAIYPRGQWALFYGPGVEQALVHFREVAHAYHNKPPSLIL